MTEVTASVLDPIRDSLDPAIFDAADSDSPQLKPEVAQWIKDRVYSALEAAGYERPQDWLRLAVTGSLCTYQWAEDSDLDVSLWASGTEGLPRDEEHDSWRAALVAVVLEHLDGTIVPGTSHPLQAFVVDVDRVGGFGDIYQPGLRAAWDLDLMEWIVPPDRSLARDVRATARAAWQHGLGVAEKMRLLLDYQPNRAKVYFRYLHRRRRADMKAGRGDFAPSNIDYKMVAKAGLFPRIEEATGIKISSRGQISTGHHHRLARIPSWHRYLHDAAIAHLHKCQSCLGRGEIGGIRCRGCGGEGVVPSEQHNHPDFGSLGPDQTSEFWEVEPLAPEDGGEGSEQHNPPDFWREAQAQTGHDYVIWCSCPSCVGERRDFKRPIDNPQVMHRWMHESGQEHEHREDERWCPSCHGMGEIGGIACRGCNAMGWVKRAEIVPFPPTPEEESDNPWAAIYRGDIYVHSPRNRRRISAQGCAGRGFRTRSSAAPKFAGNYDPIAYTYDADWHCEDCAEDRFGRCPESWDVACSEEDHGHEPAKDYEGNPVGVVSPWDEWHEPFESGDQVLSCGTCGGEIDRVEEDEEKCPSCLGEGAIGGIRCRKCDATGQILPSTGRPRVRGAGRA